MTCPILSVNLFGNAQVSVSLFTRSCSSVFLFFYLISLSCLFFCSFNPFRMLSLIPLIFFLNMQIGENGPTKAHPNRPTKAHLKLLLPRLYVLMGWWFTLFRGKDYLSYLIYLDIIMSQSDFKLEKELGNIQQGLEVCLVKQLSE